ncbi:low affinity immunoglobulin epsilon Fc receptor-like [Mytilus californianus]|uniref:low affinity immunoglobulin epsilon Fc receptor-like n=1 Tax=Mytilus californianus TaxID=6549 RepID=UPI0022479F4C|nr:low affinity immunoglobulin epsilon Fc receptor-like [Mytilus californianus]
MKMQLWQENCFLRSSKLILYLICILIMQKIVKTLLFSERRTWFKARDYCRSIGTNLVSVHNEKETNFLNNNFSKTFQWIGLSNFENNGRYMWSDGTSLDYTYWGPSQPNNDSMVSIKCLF